MIHARCRVKNDVLANLISSLPTSVSIHTSFRVNIDRGSEIRTTHDGMLKYFNLGLTREQLVAALPRGFQSGGMLMIEV